MPVPWLWLVLVTVPLTLGFADFLQVRYGTEATGPVFALLAGLALLVGAYFAMIAGARLATGQLRNRSVQLAVGMLTGFISGAGWALLVFILLVNFHLAIGGPK
jgi:NADH:ubiquinone oxidoreductase subunit 4 (subunit M)